MSIQDMDGYTNNHGDFAVILGLPWGMQPLEHWDTAFFRSTRESCDISNTTFPFPKPLRAKTFTFFGRLHHEAFHMPITFSEGSDLGPIGDHTHDLLFIFSTF